MLRRALPFLLTAALVGACRTTPEEAVSTDWDAAARRDDPTGYLEYARVRLTGDLVRLREAEVEAETRMADGEAALERAHVYHSKAEELLGPFRLAFRRAESGGGYPVTVAGIELASREAFVDQVALTLGERDGYARQATEWPIVLETLRELSAKIPARAQTVAATLELAQQQTAPSLVFVERVATVLAETSESLLALDSALEDALALAAASKPGSAGTDAALAFLEGR